jgi:hypothetical protein
VISSAATTVIQPRPTPSARPVRIDGSVAGTKTCLNTSEESAPRLFAARMYSFSMFRAPSMVLVKIGKKAPMNTTNSAGRGTSVAVPPAATGIAGNRMIAIGSHAIGGIGRNASRGT